MELKSYDEMEYDSYQEEILHIIKTKTQNFDSDTYFRPIICSYFAQVATSMRATIVTPHQGDFAPNLYVLGLAESGSGKGHSMNIMEEQILKGFRHEFTNVTFPSVAQKSMEKEARNTSIQKGTDEAEELEKIERELRNLGPYVFSFSEGSGPAYKQIRSICQISGLGATNFIGDEIGANLASWNDLMTVGLETYDVGLVKEKITKNSSDNKRGKDRHTPVPSNFLNFGTPIAVFNGAAEEKLIRSWLAQGYARRYLFAWGHKVTSDEDIPVEDLYDILTQANNDSKVTKLSQYFTALADEININRKIPMPKQTVLINLQYKKNNEKKANELSEYESVRKNELQHRHFKAKKLAGAYAFIHQSLEITEEHMYAAIKVTEDSGAAFDRIMSQESNYVKLARYIATVPNPVTYADLMEKLPFFTGAKNVKDEMVSLARAWGSKNHVVIKKYLDDGFEVLEGETLKENQLDEIIFSVSTELAYDYETSEEVGVQAWENFYKVATRKGCHWANHCFLDGHRKEEHTIPEFNIIVIDVDEGIQLDTAKKLLEGYTGFYYTTKRHTEESNRFRIVLPIKYHLKLNREEFKEFMANVYDWLPFNCDEVTNQRSKKWLSHDGVYFYTEGSLLDPTMFIPQTKENEKRIVEIKNTASMDRLECWFARLIHEKAHIRNNTMTRFMFMLYDSGMSPQNVEDAVFAFNKKIKNPLKKDELENTVIKTLWTKAQNDKRV